jgi:ABC-type uncharacterized transport system permease subunit
MKNWQCNKGKKQLKLVGSLQGLIGGLFVGGLWCVILFIVATFLWNKGVTYYQETGE